MRALATIVLASLAAVAAAAPKEHHLIAASKQEVLLTMKDPESTRFRNVRMRAPVTVCGEVNSKNSMGGYVGFKRFFVIGGAVARVEGEQDSFDSAYEQFCVSAKTSPAIPREVLGRCEVGAAARLDADKENSMKRDLDLVRKILIAMSENERGPNIKWGETIPGYEDAKIYHHAHLMAQGGLIVATDITTMSDLNPVALPMSITWDGHEFLEASNKPGLWEKAQTHIIKPAGGVAFSVLLDWLKAQATGS
jgi:hypothetical protein